MRPLREQGLFDRFSLAHGHGEDGAMKTAVRVPVLNRNDVDLAAEEAQCRSTSVRAKPRERAHSSPDDPLTVSSGDDILYGSGRDFALGLGGSENERSILHLEVSFGVLLDARQTDDLHRLYRGRWLLGMADGNERPQ